MNAREKLASHPMGKTWTMFTNMILEKKTSGPQRERKKSQEFEI
jgi:hypothetical protein